MAENIEPGSITVALAQVAQSLRDFDCVTGDPRSCHTTETGERHPYVTLGFRATKLSDAAAAVCRELKAARESFLAIPSPRLYLRTEPQAEQCFESKDWIMRVRLAIPGAAWNIITTKPEGLPYPKV